MVESALNEVRLIYILHLSTFIGEGNGTPLQYSCLENPMDGGAWWAAVYGVAKSRTLTEQLHFHFHFHALEKEMVTHSSVLAWRIPGMEEPGGCRLWGREESDMTEQLHFHVSLSCIGEGNGNPLQCSPVPGESQGWGSLVGCRLWGCTELDTTEAT